MPRRDVLFAVLLLLVPSPVSAADQADVQALLGREVIGPRQSLVEVQDYLEGRVPAMPRVESKADWEKEAARIRAALLARVVYRGEAARWRDAPANVEWQESLYRGPGYRLNKLSYEARPGPLASAPHGRPP